MELQASIDQLQMLSAQGGFTLALVLGAFSIESTRGGRAYSLILRSFVAHRSAKAATVADNIRECG